jgi:ParB-like chromosome segregation protein Spo0J
MSIVIPAAETVKLSELKTDGENPNKMGKEQLERLKASIENWGFIVPIITNKDLLIADGEQRYTAAKALGMTEVSVIRLPIEDVDRRLLRQVLNKLKGKHEKELDQLEYERIIQAGKEEDLKYLLMLSDDKLSGFLNEDEDGVAFDESFEVVVECEDEQHQEAVFNKLTGEGYKCRVLTL